MAPLIVAEEMRIPGRPTEMFSMFSIESLELGVPLAGVTPALNSAISRTSRYINGMLVIFTGLRSANLRSSWSAQASWTVLP